MCIFFYTITCLFKVDRSMMYKVKAHFTQFRISMLEKSHYMYLRFSTHTSRQLSFWYFKDAHFRSSQYFQSRIQIMRNLNTLAMVFSLAGHQSIQVGIECSVSQVPRIRDKDDDESMLNDMDLNSCQSAKWRLYISKTVLFQEIFIKIFQLV